MTASRLFLCAVLAMVVPAHAGDGIAGPHTFAVDFSQSFQRYQMRAADVAWVASLVKGLHYGKAVVHFVRTTLPLKKDGAVVAGEVYQAVEYPEYFYVVTSDAMFDLKGQDLYNPGVGGFSMHAPRSRRFIACLEFQRGGVPFMGSSGEFFIGSPAVGYRLVQWTGHLWNRFTQAEAQQP
jgi:hypothetical protein